MRLLSTILLFVISELPLAEGFTYERYRHESFRHLEFDVLDRWELMRNGLETVFTDPMAPAPELFFQTLKKTSQYESAFSFFEFLTKQPPYASVRNYKSGRSSGFPAIRFEYTEHGLESIRVYVLIVDVVEGLLWFYLKVPEEGAVYFEPIMKRISDSLSFR